MFYGGINVPNTDERRAKQIIKSKHPEKFDEVCWSSFLAEGPYYNEPETIANLYLLFLEKA